MRVRVVCALMALGLVAGCGLLPGPNPTPAAVARPSESPTSASPTPSSEPPTTAAENAKPGDEDWRIQKTAPGKIEGYASQTSVVPGTPVDLFISSKLGAVTVAAHRIGWYGGTGGRTVWTAPAPITAPKQPEAKVGSRGEIYAPWTPSLTLDTSDWPAGSYLITLRSGTRGTYVPLTVRTADPAGRLMVVNAVYTWQAYNTWGGASAYKGVDGRSSDRRSVLSFDRPYDEDGANTLLAYEQGIISHLERLGVELGYTTSMDIDAGPDAISGAKGVVFLGHDEYWSREMRTNVEAARDAGTNLAFLGANTMYWRVKHIPARKASDRPLLVVTKSEAEANASGQEATLMWRDAANADPENSLVGMLYECNPVRGDLVVTDPDFFLFRGTGASTAKPLPGLVGREIDRAYPGDGTPKNLQVVADSPVRCPATGTTRSNMTYYTTPSNAGVFAVGTLSWNLAVKRADKKRGITSESSRFAQRVTDNLARAMVAGPMGLDHPAEGNLNTLNLPTSTATGTGGSAYFR